MNMLLITVIIGTGATAFTDLWCLLRRHLLGVPFPDYVMVGRWFAHMVRGTFRHEAIGQAQKMTGEGILGWFMHYLIGIVYAGLLLVLAGSAWLSAPTVLPALGIGVATVAAPLLLMQPGMGQGLAGSRTPAPGRTRLHSLLTHAAFGLGLWVSALLLSLI